MKKEYIYADRKSGYQKIGLQGTSTSGYQKKLITCLPDSHILITRYPYCLFGILFLSGLWGFSEAVFGDALYRADVPYASVPLTVVGFVILTFACVFFPQKGTATLIAACAMLYKFLNEPFFACHLLAIFLMGVCYDLLFNVLKIKKGFFPSALVAYLSYASFAVLITYIFRYSPWVQGGFMKVLKHVGINGSMAALGCAVLLPVSFHLAQRVKANFVTPFRMQLRLVTGGVSALTIGLWVFGVMMYFIS
jgi:hypothetical protein